MKKRWIKALSLAFFYTAFLLNISGVVMNAYAKQQFCSAQITCHYAEGGGTFILYCHHVPHQGEASCSRGTDWVECGGEKRFCSEYGGQ